MAVGTKIKSAMVVKDKGRRDIATALNISDKAITAKFYRDSFSVEDLIKIADCLGYSLYLESNENKIMFNVDDIQGYIVDDEKKLDRNLPNHKRAIKNFFEMINSASDEVLGEEFDEIVRDRINITRELDL